MTCPGRNLARLQLAKVAATLVQDYDIRQANPGQEWQYGAYFTVLPHSWPVWVEKRCKK
jgi:cytochrome P450